VVAVGTASAGIPQEWAAGPNRPGVNLVSLSEDGLERVSDTVSAATRPGDLVIVSIHWGPNWGYRIPRAHRWFAQSLIDRADVNVVHGHSTHHPIGIEVYRGRLILYGCGDLINDYEGIPGHEQFRPDLGILYLADLDPASGALQGLELIPMRVRRFRLEHAPFEEATWLATVLSRESRPFGVAVERNPEGLFEAHW
jgi:poly-gamma-glutamate synthesis protein (capsule biosynthesis protein)